MNLAFLGCLLVIGGGEETPRVSGNIHVALSLQGRYAATINEGGVVAIWDVVSRKRIIECEPKQNARNKPSALTYPYTPAYVACFDPSDETTVYFCNIQGIQVWKWKDKKEP